MLPKYHVLSGFIFSLIIFLIFPEINLIGFTIIFLSSFLIDVDHYLFYVFTKKDLSLKKAHKFFLKEHKKFHKLSYKEKTKKLKKRGPWPMVFHGVETLILLGILSFFHQIFLYIIIGLIFHQVLDFIHIIYGGYSLTHLGSQTYNTIKYIKNQKK
jgi:hypothetical protein